MSRGRVLVATCAAVAGVAVLAIVLASSGGAPLSRAQWGASSGPVRLVLTPNSARYRAVVVNDSSKWIEWGGCVFWARWPDTTLDVDPNCLAAFLVAPHGRDHLYRGGYFQPPAAPGYYRLIVPYVAHRSKSSSRRLPSLRSFPPEPLSYAYVGVTLRPPPPPGQLGLATVPHSDNCVKVPQTIPTNRLLTSGTKLAVPVGAIVFVVLDENVIWTGSRSFPWLTPTTAEGTVLRRVRLCRLIGHTSVAFTVTGFRALHPGTATVNVALAPGWYGAYKPGPGPSHNTVVVR